MPSVEPYQAASRRGRAASDALSRSAGRTCRMSSSGTSEKSSATSRPMPAPCAAALGVNPAGRREPCGRGDHGAQPGHRTG